MKKSFITLMALPLLIVLFSCGEKKAPVLPPLEVPVLSVLQQDVLLESEYTGQTLGLSDIQINPRVDGVIESLNFQEGGIVTKGQVLYTIDPLPFQNKVEDAKGALAQAQADVAKTKSDLAMIEPLAKINAVSQRELVGAKSSYEAALAKLESCNARLNNAKIELGYCRITAPISGIIGISKVRVGDYVRPGAASTLNTVSDLKEMRVRFTISEQEFLRIYRDATSENSALKGAQAGKNVRLVLSDGTPYPPIGTFTFADRQVDPSTGAMTMEARFANPDNILRPGQYVKVKVVTDVRKNAVVIPQRSVIEMQGIYQVYVLGDSSKVHLQIIQPGPSFEDAYIVEDGLKAGDKIAMGGTSLLKNGSPVTPKITDWKPGQPEAKAAPAK